MLPSSVMLIVSMFLSAQQVVAPRANNGHESGRTFTLPLSVDEVVVTFHAVDANGSPVHGLKAEELRLWDNGTAPRRILAFEELPNRSLRAGILLDTSESMQRVLPENRAIAEKFVERLFRPGSDEAFVSDFGFTSDLIQPWTADASLLRNGIATARPRGNRPGGTALFNAVFQACSSSFERVDPAATGNLLLVFSDGQDNAGLTSSDEAARACQRSNTRVFAFVPSDVQQGVSIGPKALRELASKTGGRVFLGDGSDDAASRQLAAIESEMRNEYRLVHKPANLKPDGAFHQIILQPPDRVFRIEVRSGYFAPHP